MSAIGTFGVNRPLTNDKQAKRRRSASIALSSSLGSSSDEKTRLLASRKTPKGPEPREGRQVYLEKDDPLERKDDVEAVTSDGVLSK